MITKHRRVQRRALCSLADLKVANQEEEEEEEGPWLSGSVTQHVFQVTVQHTVKCDMLHGPRGGERRPGRRRTSRTDAGRRAERGGSCGLLPCKSV